VAAAHVTGEKQDNDSMKLENSATGESFSISPMKYEFPLGTDEFDSNWLVISGEVRAPKRSWKFWDAGLLSWEAENISTWLRRAAAGRVLPVPDGEFETSSNVLDFVEPNLRLSVALATRERMDVRIHLAHEWAPPSDGEDDYPEYVMTFSMAPGEWMDIANSWASELKPFAVREPNSSTH
jgi:hypothetical protein